jgi:hypothetical protein
MKTPEGMLEAAFGTGLRAARSPRESRESGKMRRRREIDANVKG